MEDNKPVLMARLMRTAAEWRQYTRRVALKAGIPEAYRPILRYLRRNPGASQKELAEDMCVSGAAASRTVNEMLENGYVTRSEDEKDRRVKRLTLTDKGRECGETMRRALSVPDALIYEKLGPEDSEKLLETLEKLSDIIHEMGK